MYPLFSPIKNCKPMSPLFKENFEYNYICIESTTVKNILYCLGIEDCCGYLDFVLILDVRVDSSRIIKSM